MSKLSKIIFLGTFFILLVGAGVFFFLRFAFPEITIERFTDVFPSFQAMPDNDKREEDVLEGIVREGDIFERGELTREGIIEETNRRRSRFEDELLEENDLLNEIAERKLNNMFEKQYFAHVSPEGLAVGDIAKEKGYEFLLIGDNLAKGNYRDDKDVVGDWMDSPGHRKNILDHRYKEIGVAAKKGEFEGREAWIAIQVFGMPTWACPEVDGDLLAEVEKKKERAETLEERREELKREIDRVERGSEQHIEKVEEYNKLVREYNNLISSLGGLIDEYNRQIQLREDCVRG